jgi:hypothetical protein
MPCNSLFARYPIGLPNGKHTSQVAKFDYLNDDNFQSELGSCDHIVGISELKVVESNKAEFFHKIVDSAPCEHSRKITLVCKNVDVSLAETFHQLFEP